MNRKDQHDQQIQQDIYDRAGQALHSLFPSKQDIDQMYEEYQRQITKECWPQSQEDQGFQKYVHQIFEKMMRKDLHHNRHLRCLDMIHYNDALQYRLKNAKKQYMSAFSNYTLNFDQLEDSDEWLLEEFNRLGKSAMDYVKLNSMNAGSDSDPRELNRIRNVVRASYLDAKSSYHMKQLELNRLFDEVRASKNRFEKAKEKYQSLEQSDEDANKLDQTYFQNILDAEDEFLQKIKLTQLDDLNALKRDIEERMSQLDQEYKDARTKLMSLS